MPLKEDFLTACNADAFITSDYNTMFYLSGFSGSFGFAVVTKDGNYYLTDSRYFEEAGYRLKGFKAVLTTYSEAPERLKELLRGKVGFEADKLTVAEFERLKSTGLDLADVSLAIKSIMAVKTKEETEDIQAACAVTEAAYERLIKIIAEGVAERDLAAELDYIMKKEGADCHAFEPIVAFGKNTSVPHHRPGTKKLRNNEPVLLDFGARYRGYCSDMTRTLFFGTPDKKFKNAYETVLRAHYAGFEAIKTGLEVARADRAARDIIDASSFKGCFTHSLGHGIGVNIHENPTIGPKGEGVFEDNMVFSVEPGIYLDGGFGIRIEDTVALTAGKPISFMKTDKDLICI